MLNYTASTYAAKVLRAINNKTRRRIIDLLSDKGELCVSDIQTALKIEQSVTSMQLGVLRRQKIVSARRDSKSVYYSMNTDRIAHIMHCVNELVP